MMHQFIKALNCLRSTYGCMCGDTTTISDNSYIYQNDRLAECTHTDSGRDVTIKNNDGTVTCPICTATWNPNISVEELNKSIDVVLAAIQNTKMAAGKSWNGQFQMYHTGLYQQFYHIYKNQ